MLFKKLEVPEADDATKHITNPQLWYVRWQSRHGEYSADTRPQLEAFPSEAQAETFANELRNAFRLLKITSGNDVIISCN